MGFLNKVKGKLKEVKENADSANVSGILKHLEGVPSIAEGVNRQLTISPEDNKLYISKDGKYKENSVSLDLDKLVFAEDTTVEEITEKNKSVVGRATVGLLLGPIGAVVGGLSGVGSKSKSKDIRVLVIGYESEGEARQMSFMGGKGTFGYTLVAGRLKRLLKDRDSSYEL